MSAIGTKRTCRVALHMSAFGVRANCLPRWFWSITLSSGPASTESECSRRGPSRGIGPPIRRSHCPHRQVGFGRNASRVPIPFFCGVCSQVLVWLSRPPHQRLLKAVSFHAISCGTSRIWCRSPKLLGGITVCCRTRRRATGKGSKPPHRLIIPENASAVYSLALPRLRERRW
jgi:hypothetical protein